MVLTGEVVLPSCLKKLQPWTVDLPQRRYTWFSNEEIASILINFKKHSEWMTPTRVHRPENGKLLMFNRKKVKYRQDTYIWKTKRKSKWPREDHVKLKVHSIPCISAVYVHSDVLPSFHRRCYWFIQNPDVVLVHYLNFPYMDDDIHITKDFSLNPQCQQWQDLTKQDILEQIQPMFSNMPWPRISDPFLSDEYVKKLTNNLVDQHFEQLRCRIYKKLNDRCIGQLRAIQPKSDAITELGNTSSVSLTSCRGSNSNSLTSIGTGQQTVSNCSRNNSNVELHNASKINTASTIPTNVLSNGSTVIILSQPSIADRNIAPTNNAIYASCDIATSTTQIDMDNSITISFETPASAVPFSNLSNDQQMVCQTITPLLPHTGTSNPLVQDCHNIEGSTTLMTNCRDDAKEKSVKAKEIISCSSQVHSVFDQVQSNFEDMATLPREEAKQSVNCIDHTLVKSKSCNELLMLSKSPSDKLTDPLSSTATPLHSSNFNNEMSLSLPVRTNGDALGLSASWNHDDLLYENNAHKSDYGAKDVMVPNCRSSKGQSDLSPFAGHQIQSSSELLDVFDVDSLFNTNTSEESISPLQRLTNPSTEYTVGDLFPQHLWDPVLREADGHLGISSSNPNEQSECALSNLAEIQSFTQAMPPDEMSRLETITDYSPDWSYTEGGIKVLLTGTWSAPGNYNCSFNEVCVPATILQPGVLRCYCPAHNVGHVNLLIKRDGLVVSYAVKFEYKLIPSPYRDVSRYWLQLNENEFKMSILERLERMEKRLNSMGYSNNICNTGDQNMPGGGLHYRIRGLSSKEPESTTKSELDFEQRLILLCCQISQASSEQRSALCEAENSSGDGLTLLHYTTALGYVRLLKSLRLMRQESDNEFLRYECDPRSRDRLDCTPLMWACAAGHLGCIDVLLEWNASCLHIVDVLGRSPASLAQQYGHMTIFNRLECMIDEANRNNSVLQDENEDTADTSSIGDTTASSVLDTADSGEDSMETDDNLSIEPDSIQAEVTQCDDCNFSFEWQGFENDLNTSQEVGSQSTSNTPSQTSTGLGIENSLPRMPLNDTTFEGQSDCLTVLAEQIVEAAPDYLKYEGDGGQEYSDNDLTLRSLPFYVNSRCGAGVYPTFTTNQNYNIFRRDAPIVNRMNWSEFLQLPPRPVLPEARYQSNNDLELDSFRLTENEQRQLYLAATTVLKAYHCEGLPLQTEVLRASLLIQGCYRKYKKFAVNKKMNEAAVLIQSKFRSYQEQKRFQKSRHAAILIQSFYRSYKYTRAGERSTKRTVRLIEDALRGHMTKKKQHQAARKIQRFLRQCRYRLRQQELSAESKSKSPRMAGYYTC